MFQQLSGIYSIIFFCVDIFLDAETSIDENLSAIIVGVVLVLATGVTSAIGDKAHRFLFLLISEIIMTVSMFFLGLYFYLKEMESVESIQWLPIVAMSMFVAGFSVGIGPIPVIMIEELLPANTKGN